MNRWVKYLIIFLVVDIVLVGLYFAFRGGGEARSPLLDHEWVVIDDYYTPADYVEEFIKNDAMQRDALPVSIKNYGKNKAVLKRFRGKNFAKPRETDLRLMYRGMEDWKLVDLKYEERDREVLRTILYVKIKGEWSVGDTGTLVR